VKPPKPATAPEKPVPPAKLEGLFVVSATELGMMLDRFVRVSLGGLPWTQVRGLIEQGQVRVNGVVERQTTFPLSLGVEVQVGGKGKGAPRESLHASDFTLLHSDSHLVVVEKPCGVSTEPYDENEKDALTTRLSRKLKFKPYVVHRLDKETSGVLVFARTIQARDHLKNQFRFHTTSRFYVALVHGTPESRTIRSRIVRDRGDGLRGSTNNPTLGRDSTTHIEVLETFGEASLVRCRLETGRTHQIRIHLAEAGHPLLGERVYSRGFRGELVTAPRVMLHAQHLGLNHPVSEERLEFERPAPADFLSRLEELRTLGRGPAPGRPGFTPSAPKNGPPARQERRHQVDARPNRGTLGRKERGSSRGPRR